jgi:hypothetical protein
MSIFDVFVITTLFLTSAEREGGNFFTDHFSKNTDDAPALDLQRYIINTTINFLIVNPLFLSSSASLFHLLSCCFAPQHPSSNAAAAAAVVQLSPLPSPATTTRSIHSNNHHRPRSLVLNTTRHHFNHSNIDHSTSRPVNRIISSCTMPDDWPNTASLVDWH